MGDGAVQVQGEGARVVPGEDRDWPVPSGQAVRLIETIWEAPGPSGATTVRFRFLAPAIAREGGGIGRDAATTDMMALCRDVALPAIAAQGGAAPAQIVISMSDRVVPFGETQPEATQYFEAYTIEDGDCVWSLF